MSKVFPGRYTAHIEGAFVVFLIGMRINRLLAFNKWIPTAAAMSPMLRELYANPDSGFLGAHSSVYWRGVMVTQYWRSFDHLIAYAQDRNANHLPAWASFNRRVGTDGTVGIWHETYQVAAGQYECIYANAPRMGLALAADHILPPAISAKPAPAWKMRASIPGRRCATSMCHPERSAAKSKDLRFVRTYLSSLKCHRTSTRNVISTGAVRLHRAAQWRDPCISSLLLSLPVLLSRNTTYHVSL